MLTGGFPCQPFSQAGKRKGQSDDRYLWPAMLTVIKNTKPRWIIGENVAGIKTMVFNESVPEMEDNSDVPQEDFAAYTNILDGIIGDLELLGYTVQAFIIPACAVNAPHRRDRVWIVAHSRCEHGEGRQDRGKSQGSILGKKNAPMFERSISNDGQRTDTNPNNSGIGTSSKRINKDGKEKIKERKYESFNRAIGHGIDASNSGDKRLQRERTKGSRYTRQQDRAKCDKGRIWNKNWLEVATELCGVDDGLPVRMDGFELSKSKHRTERLKALGNAIVPQVAMEIMKAIREVDLK